MSISLGLPPDIEERVRIEGANASREAKEAYLIDLYRQERITHNDLGDALGLGFHQTEQLLKDHGVGLDFTLEEFKAERLPPDGSRTMIAISDPGPLQYLILIGCDHVLPQLDERNGKT